MHERVAQDGEHQPGVAVDAGGRGREQPLRDRAAAPEVVDVEPRAEAGRHEVEVLRVDLRAEVPVVGGAAPDRMEIDPAHGLDQAQAEREQLLAGSRRGGGGWRRSRRGPAEGQLERNRRRLGVIDAEDALDADVERPVRRGELEAVGRLAEHLAAKAAAVLQRDDGRPRAGRAGQKKNRREQGLHIHLILAPDRRTRPSNERQFISTPLGQLISCAS